MPSTGSPSFLPALETFLADRLADPTPGSYSHTVMTDPVLAQRKIMEEAFEVCLEIAKDSIDPSLLAEEAADLVFHLLAALVGAGLPWSDVEAALVARHAGASS